MATKFQMITELYDSTVKDLLNIRGKWLEFLTTACRNYKCSFDDQILIYAQRPNATAVLEIEKWNEQFGRWVNKGATGIAVFDRGYNGRSRLKHYFDVADTHESRFSRSVPIWEMQPAFETEVIEALENTFGELTNKRDLANAIISASKNAVDDNITDYLRDLIDCKEHSFIEDLDEFNIEVVYKRLVRNSMAYMMMTRCGIDTNKYFDVEDLVDIFDFNTQDTFNALGVASMDITEMGLREISSTVLSLAEQKQHSHICKK